LQNKLEVNADHSLTPQAKMVFVFGFTGGDAETHLRQRYAGDSVNPFLSEGEMIDY
jgi:hypothetical protein